MSVSFRGFLKTNGESLSLHYKRQFIINVLAISVFYCTFREIKKNHDAENWNHKATNLLKGIILTSHIDYGIILWPAEKNCALWYIINISRCLKHWMELWKPLETNVPLPLKILYIWQGISIPIGWQRKET